MMSAPLASRVSMSERPSALVRSLLLARSRPTTWEAIARRRSRDPDPVTPRSSVDGRHAIEIAEPPLGGGAVARVAADGRERRDKERGYREIGDVFREQHSPACNRHQAVADEARPCIERKQPLRVGAEGKHSEHRDAVE